MKVWVGLQKDGEYVHEWEEDVSSETEAETAIGRALAEYKKTPGASIWGLTILIDKEKRQR
jgi:hypothetical protein